MKEVGEESASLSEEASDDERSSGGDGCDDDDSEEAMGAGDDVYENIENEIDGRVVEEALDF